MVYRRRRVHRITFENEDQRRSTKRVMTKRLRAEEATIMKHQTKTIATKYDPSCIITAVLDDYTSSWHADLASRHWLSEDRIDHLR